MRPLYIKLIGFAFILILQLNHASAQSKKSNPFKMIEVGQDIEKQLSRYLIQTGEIDSILMGKAGILKYELIKKDIKSHYAFVDGIYLFKINGPHFKPYLFYKQGKSIHIFQEYKLDPLLTEVLKYFKTENTPFKEQLMYVQAIIDVMKTRNNIDF